MPFRLLHNKLVSAVFSEIAPNVFVFTSWFLDFVGSWACSFENLLHAHESNLNNNAKYMDKSYIFIFLLLKKKKKLKPITFKPIRNDFHSFPI